MNLFSLFTLFGGLAFFLYGMNVMSGSLEKMSGGKLERTLKEMTSTPLKSMLFGAGVTVAVQSSSALTVMLVGLVNSGIITLRQTVGVLMGSNIGTTLTTWLLALAGVESNNFFMQLLKPVNFAPLAAFIGILCIMTSKKESKKNTGTILLGFAILMSGMTMMSDSVSPLADMPEFASILTMFNNPILGVLVGAVFTGIIQSSAASVGILIALSLTGGITFRMAIPIIMGQNIGTCVTALISSIGVNKNAKRVAVVHITFNLIGTLIGLVVFYGGDMILHFSFLDQPIYDWMISFCHSVFNIATTIILIPFMNQLVKIAEFVIKDDDKEEVYTFLDERVLKLPQVALEECSQLTVKMGKIAQHSLMCATRLLLEGYNEKDDATIRENEFQLDMFEDKLSSFLVRLSSQALPDADSQEVNKLLHTIGDFERIGDHSNNIADFMKSMNEKDQVFSDEAYEEFKVICNALNEIVTMTIEVFKDNDKTRATDIEPLEEVVDSIVAKMKRHHIRRLQKGSCTVDLGYILSDILNNLERVSDHCSNIAISIIEENILEFDAHEYISTIHSKDNPEFQRKYREYKDKFAL